MGIEIRDGLAYVMDALAIVFVVQFWWSLKQHRREGATPGQLAGVLGIGLAWGLAWTFPPLRELRLSQPFAQPLAIGASILFFTAAGFLGPGRTYFRTVGLEPILQTGVWRIIYGVLLLANGLAGGLPPAFFWSAGIGDIIAGVWALALLFRNIPPSRNALLACNAFGLLDMIHVLALGSITLLPFFKANPDVTYITLLPVVAVPIMISLHLQAFRTILGRASHGGQRIAAA
jgi:hypothetical protein